MTKTPNKTFPKIQLNTLTMPSRIVWFSIVPLLMKPKALSPWMCWQIILPERRALNLNFALITLMGHDAVPLQELVESLFPAIATA